MKKRAIRAVVMIFSVLYSAGAAQAITVDGQNFQKLISLDVKDSESFGYWVDKKKFYTLRLDDHNIPLDIDSTSDAASEVAGYDFASFYTMGTTRTAEFSSEIASGLLRIHDSNGATVLEANYRNSGTFNVVPIKGDRGEISAQGVFTIVGGSLFDQGVLNGSLFVEMVFNRVNYFKGPDITAMLGGINLYSSSVTTPPTPPSEVPEPASALLLGLASAAGFLRRRRA